MAEPVCCRNPYDRLLSAYKDKALRENGRYVRGRLCTDWYRIPAHPVLTFQQFLECIIKEVEKQDKNISLSHPSAGQAFDMHWTPQTLLCNPCFTNYTLVGEFTHMNEDMEDLLVEFSMNTTVEHSNSDQEMRHPSKYKSYADYYSAVDGEVIQQIQQLYKQDFEILGYNPDPLGSI